MHEQGKIMIFRKSINQSSKYLSVCVTNVVKASLFLKVVPLILQ